MTDSQRATTTTGLPATMHAVVQHRYGTDGVLGTGEVPRPEPGRGQVLVRVRAAGVDKGVWHLVTGRPYMVRLGSGLRRPRRRVPGVDLAGVVEALGPGAEGFTVGDEVFGTARGTWAEFVAAPVAKLAHRPAALSWEEAAAVPVSAETALAALREARVGDGDRVLVLGASGGVGTYAVQFARALGARVTGVCSAAKADLVRSLGAEVVLDHASADPVDGSVTYDAVLDIGGNHRLRDLRRALEPSGALVLVGGDTGGRFTGGYHRQLFALGWGLFVRPRVKVLVAPESGDLLREIASLLEDGTVRPVLDRVVGLDGAAGVLADLGAGRIRGKAVVSVSPG